MQIELPYDPAIPLLGIHTEETRIERDTNVVFLGTFSSIAFGMFTNNQKFQKFEYMV